MSLWCWFNSLFIIQINFLNETTTTNLDRLFKVKIRNMDLSSLLKGKKAIIKTEVGVDVQLEIEKVEEKYHSEDLEPATKENDWWPKSRSWTTYDITFINGYRKSYHSISEIILAEETLKNDHKLKNFIWVGLFCFIWIFSFVVIKLKSIII